MEQKIKEVQDYFKAKILSGFIEVVETTEATITVSVDDKYKFTFLIGNFPTVQYECGANFVRLELTRDEQLELNTLLHPVNKQWKKEVLLNQKREELLKLESELGTL